MLFEWDENKNKSNLDKHGIDFVDASKVFLQRSYVFKSDYSGNDVDRHIAVGEVNQVVIAVVYTIRQKNIRIISARRARDEEKRKYNELLSR